MLRAILVLILVPFLVGVSWSDQLMPNWRTSVSVPGPSHTGINYRMLPLSSGDYLVLAKPVGYLSRYSAEGNIIWGNRLNSFGGPMNRLHDAALLESSDGKIFLGTRDLSTETGWVIAVYDGASGTELWTYAPQYGPDGGRCYFGAVDSNNDFYAMVGNRLGIYNKIIKLDGDDGAIQWQHSSADLDFYSNVVVLDGYVYALVTRDTNFLNIAQAEIRKLDSATGQLIAAFPVALPMGGSEIGYRLFSDNGQLYVYSDAYSGINFVSGCLTKLSADGVVQWHCAVPIGFQAFFRWGYVDSSSVTIESGFGSNDPHKIFRINKSTGILEWSFDLKQASPPMGLASSWEYRQVGLLPGGRIGVSGSGSMSSLPVSGPPLGASRTSAIESSSFADSTPSVPDFLYNLDNVGYIGQFNIEDASITNLRPIVHTSKINAADYCHPLSTGGAIAIGDWIFSMNSTGDIQYSIDISSDRLGAANLESRYKKSSNVFSLAVDETKFVYLTQSAQLMLRDTVTGSLVNSRPISALGSGSFVTMSYMVDGSLLVVLKEAAKFVIYNLDGQLLVRWSMEIASGASTFKFDFSDESVFLAADGGRVFRVGADHSFAETLLPFTGFMPISIDWNESSSCSVLGTYDDGGQTQYRIVVLQEETMSTTHSAMIPGSTLSRPFGHVSLTNNEVYIQGNLTPFQSVLYRINPSSGVVVWTDIGQVATADARFGLINEYSSDCILFSNAVFTERPRSKILDRDTGLKLADEQMFRFYGRGFARANAFGSVILNGTEMSIVSGWAYSYSIPYPFYPSNFIITQGSPFGGDLNSLKHSDDNSLYILCDEFGPNGELEIPFSTGTGEYKKLDLHIESATTHPNMIQLIQLYNYDSNSFQTVRTDALSISDTEHSYTTTNHDPWINESLDIAKARVKWIPAEDLVAEDGWSDSVDRARLVLHSK